MHLVATDNRALICAPMVDATRVHECDAFDLAVMRSALRFESAGTLSKHGSVLPAIKSRLGIDPTATLEQVLDFLNRTLAAHQVR